MSSRERVRAESRAASQQIALTNNLQLAVAGGALALLLIAAMIVSRRPKVPAELAAPVVAQNEVKSILSLPKTPAPSSAPPPPAVAPAPPAFTAPVVQGPGAVVNLTEAADLCVDLGRLMDAREVPALLERAASVLGANGVILWVADPAGTQLRPSLSHGYPDKVIPPRRHAAGGRRQRHVARLSHDETAGRLGCAPRHARRDRRAARDVVRVRRRSRR